MLADMYKDSMERGRAMSTSFIGLALGLIGVYTGTASTCTYTKIKRFG